MQSITKVQNANIDWLGGIGDNPSLYTEDNSVIGKAIQKTILEAQNKLRKLGKVSTGNLSDIQHNTIIIGDVVTITIGYDKKNKASKYYDFIDAGVDGTMVNNGGKYRYKNNFVSTEMLNSIKKWAKGNKRSGRNDDQKHNTNKTQKKRASLQGDSNAWAIAVSVKKKGHKPTHFLSDAIERNFGNSFKEKYTKSIGQQIAINVKNDFK